MAEELQSMSGTSLRLLPLAMPVLPGRTGGDAVRTPTHTSQAQLILKGFRKLSPSESYETHSRAM